jgi:hypothetical protein
VLAVAAQGAILATVETLLLALHLLCVNLATGGPLLAAWLDWRGNRGNAVAASAARQLATWSLAGLIAGAMLGIAVGWLKWDAAYRDVWLDRLSYKMHFAGLEASFSLLLLLIWWWFLPRAAGGSRPAAVARCVLAVLAATNLLYHFPLLFSVAARLYDSGQTAGARIDGALFRQLMLQGETPAIAVHVVLASLAVGGTALIAISLLAKREKQEQAVQLALSGGRWAAAATVLQLPVGLWTLAMLPASAQSRLMGQHSVGTLLFVAALLAALWLARELANVALGDVSRPVRARCIAAMIVTVVLMTGMQQASRGPRLSKTSTLKPSEIRGFEGTENNNGNEG